MRPDLCPQSAYLFSYFFFAQEFQIIKIDTIYLLYQIVLILDFIWDHALNKNVKSVSRLVHDLTEQS